MTTIRILPEILSNQIAAGEVVERPVSVAKELVENCIDAKAENITIEVEKGGKSLIRVSDDGHGLSRDNALLSIERYATSKIFTKEDLFSISTMGFRGEALPSIASVSKFTMVTRTRDSNIGTRIEIAGGKVKDVNDAGSPVGTMVEVKHLFFNTPARKKFLKSDRTEISHIADAVSGIALGSPGIGFRLFFDGKLVKHFGKAHDLFQRSVNVLGKETIKKLYPLDVENEFCTVKGYTANPLVTRSSSSRIFLFVNNRLIYDRGLVAALFKGYKGRIMKGRFPMTVLFLQVPYNQVDVNVHPSKKEVKFYHYRDIYQAVTRAVETALQTAQKDMSGYSRTPAAQAPAGRSVKKSFVFRPADPVDAPRVEQTVIQWEEPLKKIQAEQAQEEIRLPEESKAAAPAGELFSIIGQVMGTYILAESEDGLVIIDQHAAHERIVYEQLQNRQASMTAAGQELVVPEVLELSFKEADVLSGLLEDLENLGFKIEPFGGSSFVVKAVPAIIDEKQTRPVIVEIIEKRIENKTGSGMMEKWLDETLELMACHSAVRANKRMTKIEMEHLVKDLQNCGNPMHCPHGRPVMVTLDKAHLEKLFKRVV